MLANPGSLGFGQERKIYSAPREDRSRLLGAVPKPDSLPIKSLLLREQERGSGRPVSERR